MVAQQQTYKSSFIHHFAEGMENHLLRPANEVSFGTQNF